MRVEYDRFERLQSPNEMRIELPAEAVRAGTVRLRLNRAFMERVNLERIEPEPESVAVDGDGFVYELLVGASGRPAPVVARYEYRTFGRSPVRVAVEGGPAVAFEQWVYP